MNITASKNIFSIYVADIVQQKNSQQWKIISNFKKARNSYRGLRIASEKVRIKGREDELIAYLESDKIEAFFKAFSKNDFYDKKYIAKYGLNSQSLPRRRGSAIA